MSSIWSNFKPHSSSAKVTAALQLSPGSQLKSELPRRAQVITICPMLFDLTFDYTKHVDVLEGERPAIGFRKEEDPTIERDWRFRFVPSLRRDTTNDPFTFRYHFVKGPSLIDL